MGTSRFLEKLLFLFEPSFIKIRREKKQRVTVQGKCYNLQEIFRDVNHHYFGGELDLAITWSGSRLSKPKRTAIFGSYHEKQRLIRIHRRLDEPHVPLYFITFVVYHEMLHHVFPPIRKKRKRSIHHAAFKKKEKEFVEYGRVKTYKKELRKELFGSQGR